MEGKIFSSFWLVRMQIYADRWEAWWLGERLDFCLELVAEDAWVTASLRLPVDLLEKSFKLIIPRGKWPAKFAITSRKFSSRGYRVARRNSSRDLINLFPWLQTMQEQAEDTTLSCSLSQIRIRWPSVSTLSRLGGQKNEIFLLNAATKIIWYFLLNSQREWN